MTAPATATMTTVIVCQFINHFVAATNETFTCAPHIANQTLPVCVCVNVRCLFFCDERTRLMHNSFSMRVRWQLFVSRALSHIQPCFVCMCVCACVTAIANTQLGAILARFFAFSFPRSFIHSFVHGLWQLRCVANWPAVALWFIHQFYSWKHRRIDGDTNDCRNNNNKTRMRYARSGAYGEQWF